MAYNLSDGRVLTYRIVENGYYIDINDHPTIYQYEPYIPNKDLSYEENAIAQIKDMVEADKAAQKQAEEDASMSVGSRLSAVEDAVQELILQGVN